MKVYVRRGRHLLEGKLRSTLDIATIDVVEQGKGTFTSFLDLAQKLNPWDATYIENVLEPRFATYFLKRGWLEANFDSPTPCFYMPSKTWKFTEK
jgi:hypothetical protein